MKVYITSAAPLAGEATKAMASPPSPPPHQHQQAATRRGCRSAVVTGLLAGVLLFRAALLTIEAGASLCPSTTGKFSLRTHRGHRRLLGELPIFVCDMIISDAIGQCSRMLGLEGRSRGLAVRRQRRRDGGESLLVTGGVLVLGRRVH